MADKRPIILLIDDNEAVRIFFKDLFWLHGLESKFQVECADGVEKGEKMIKDPETRPEVVFLDLVMPINKDGKIITTPEAGLSLLEKIKSDPELKNVKVVIFSSYGDKFHRERAEKLGAEMFLDKAENLPQDLIKLIDVVDKKYNLSAKK